MNLVLVGYRGSGKSTIGALLAAKMGWAFVDSDDLVVQKSGRSIAAIFAQEGEAGFRELEKEVCRGLRRRKNHVIALGGGAVLDPEIRGIARQIGRVVWLRAPAVVLWSRISQDPRSAAMRPDLRPGGGLPEVEAVLKQREPLYRKTANHWVDTYPGTPEQIAETIRTWFEANDATRAR